MRPCSGATAIPADPDRCRRSSSTVNRSSRESSRLRATCRRPPGHRRGHQDGELVAPQPRDRHARWRSLDEPVRHLAQQVVTDVVTEGVVDDLEAVEVDDHQCHQAAGAPGLRQGLVRPGGELRPVRQAGQGIVQRVVAEPADQHLVVQRHRRVVGDRLEQVDVAGYEAAHLAEPVVHRQRTDGLPVVAQRRQHGLVDTAQLQVVTHGRVVPTDEDRVGVPEQRPGRLGGDAGRVLVERHDRAAVEPPDGDLGVAEAQHLGGLPAQQLAGLVEHGGQHVVGLRRDAQLAAEPEQPLEAAVPVGERGVGAVARHQHHAGGDQRDGGDEAEAEGEQWHQPDEGAGRGEPDPGHQAPQPRQRWLPVVPADDHAEDDEVHRHGRAAGEDRPGPLPPAVSRAAAPDDAEHRESDGRVGEDQRDVDAGLEQGLAPVQQHDQGRSDHAGDEEVVGDGVEERQHERDLADGDALGLAADLDVEDPYLGRGEHQREHPPGDPQVQRRVRRMGLDAEPESGADEGEQADQSQHAPGGSAGPS